MAQAKISQQNLMPPVAKKLSQELIHHEDKRIDDYFWLRQQDNSEVIDYLKAENAYTEAKMKHTEELQKTLYAEMLARIKETDLSVPYRLDDYYYYSRTEEGKAYAIFCRKHGSLDAPEEILLDQNQLAEGKEYFSLGVAAISPNHQILAYSVDTTGAEQYTLFFLNLASKDDSSIASREELYSETIPNTYYSLAWANDNQTVFYTKVDDTNRPYQLWRHRLGSDPSEDVLVYQEDDEAYFLSVGKTRSRRYILLELGSKVTSEIHYLDANNPTEAFQVIHPRQQDMEYSVEHHSDYFYIVTNDEAINFKLMKAPVDFPNKANWTTVIPHREEVMLSDIDAFADYLIIYERKAGLPTARIQKLATGEETEITFPEPTYSFSGDNNPEFKTNKWRFNYSSMITPASVFDYDLETGERGPMKLYKIGQPWQNEHFYCQ
jgi:oligopeptidase B